MIYVQSVLKHTDLIYHSTQKGEEKNITEWSASERVGEEWSGTKGIRSERSEVDRSREDQK